MHVSSVHTACGGMAERLLFGLVLSLAERGCTSTLQITQHGGVSRNPGRMFEDLQCTPPTCDDAGGDQFQLTSEINRDLEGWVLHVQVKPATRETITHGHNSCALSHAPRGVATCR